MKIIEVKSKVNGIHKILVDDEDFEIILNKTYMKTGLKFLAVIVLLVVSFVLLLRIGNRAEDWTFWLVLIFLPTAGYLIGKTNFQSPE
jgi:hypothetical protein